MNKKISYENRIEVIASLMNGKGITITARSCSVSLSSVQRIFNEIKDSLVDAKCSCGRKLNHKGHCWAHGKPAAKKPVMSSPEELELLRTEGNDRTVKQKWLEYMLQNPVYFEFVFGKKWSFEEVKRRADIEFSIAICKCCGRRHRRISCLPECNNDTEVFYFSIVDAHEIGGMKLGYKEGQERNLGALEEI